MAETPPRFSPLRPASAGRRATLFLVGPVLWVAAFSVLGLVVSESDAVGFGLLIAGISFLLGLIVLLALRGRRIREEREGAPAHSG